MMYFNIGQEVKTTICNFPVKGIITGKHGDADFYAVRLSDKDFNRFYKSDLDITRVIYKWSNQLTAA